MKSASSYLALLSAGTAVLLVAQATPALADVTPIRGKVSSAAAFQGVQSGWAQPDPIRDLISSTGNILRSQDPDTPNAFETASNSVVAHWDSANSGNVQINGQLTVNQGPFFDDDIQISEGGSFQYDFTADVNGTFKFDLNSTFEDSGIYIGTWAIGVFDLDRSQQIVQRADGYVGGNTLELAGSLQLQAGHSYTFQIANGGSSFDFPLVGFIPGEEQGVATWSITPDAAAVPEPTAWALMLVGFASAGAMLRGRRRRLRLA